jgi:transcriptional regulator with XRE-family HTH domain
MPGSFGARLRLRREEQGIPLGTIADELKIKLSLLEAVERDDVSHWPSGIYRRAFIRAYAHAIGLNPDVVVREFLELHPDPDEATAAAFATASAPTPENGSGSGGPPTRLRNIMGSAIGSLSRLGRGSVQNPIAVRGSAISLQEEAHLPPLPSTVSLHDLPSVVRPAEVLAHRTNQAVPPLPAPAAPAADEDLLESVTKRFVVTEAVVPTETVVPTEGVGGTEAVLATENVVGTETVVATESTLLGETAVEERELPYVPAPAVQLPPAPSPQSVAMDHLKAPDIDLLAAAQVCTGFACVRDSGELQLLLQEASTVLGASGLIVWLWDGNTQELRPALVVGYSDKVLAQLPTVSRDADNPTAAAFRSGQPCMMRGDDHTGGALVVPLVEPDGCAGVLAMEFQDGGERRPSVHAVAMIFAASLSQLAGSAQPADVAPHPEVVHDPPGTLTRPLRVRR